MANSEGRLDLKELRQRLHQGMVIPAHPLALNASRQLDERRQRALSRYYLDSGAGGLAVGVHTTQFEIHRPEVGLYVPVLELALEELQAHEREKKTPLLRVAGIVGKTAQAVNEASIARTLGYDCGLLSMGALRHAGDEELLEHARAVAEILPLFGFYLQPAVGGRTLSYDFWHRFAEIPNVIAIKIAPFNRYFTIDVIRGVASAGRLDEIALYTGNDDNIITDLITPFRISAEGKAVTARIRGGLLGHWAFWTARSVETLGRIQQALANQADLSDFLALNTETTDANSAIFDARNQFRGCIPGIHEILRRQGLLEGVWCLDPEEVLSPGQGEEIDRVCRQYPHLTDDQFVSENLDKWNR